MSEQGISLKDGWGASLACAVTLGVFSSLGDWIWANYITDGAVIPGVVHGLLIFLLLAVVLGLAAGEKLALRRLLFTLPLSGLVIAASFYPIAMVVGYIGGLLVTWAAMWLTLALLQRWSRSRTEPLGRSLARAGAAMILSGLAFWAISGIWTGAAQQPVNYIVRAGYWAFAFLPGFLALLVGHSRTE